MSIYTESGIQINLTKYPHLRLKDCEDYKLISKFYFKEVDFIWWNPQEKCLYLSDFKDFRDVQSGAKIDRIIPNLADKSMHVLALLCSIWLNTEGSREIASFFGSNLPPEALRKSEVKIIHVINCPPVFDMHFSSVNSEFMSRFSAFSTLFDIKTSLILPIGSAKKYFDVFI